jgi:small subunit ribosomal protein S6
MNKYETVFIIDADTAEADEQAIVERIRSLTSQHGGRLLAFDDWGMRKFAYEIRKKKQGHYIRIEYGGTGELVHAIERFFRMDYRVLKFMTVNLEKNVDPEALSENEPEAALTATAAEEAAEGETPSEPSQTAAAASGEAAAETETESQQESKEG